MTACSLVQPLRRHESELERGSTREVSWWRRFIAWFGLTALFAMLTGSAVAAPDLIIASPDVTLNFNTAGATGFIEDEDVLVGDLLGTVTELSLGSSVAAREEISVKGIHDEGNALLMVFDEPLQLPGLIPSPGDVVRFTGVNSYEVIFDASAEGIPAGVEVDAVTRGSDGELALSFNTHVSFGSFTAADEDLVGFDGNSFSLLFDGSAAGILPALDLDAASFDSEGLLYLSFDGSGMIGELPFRDEDVLEYDISAEKWSADLAADSDGGAVGAPSVWRLADVEALHVPEPGLGGGLAAGFALLLAAIHRRAS